MKKLRVVLVLLVIMCFNLAMSCSSVFANSIDVDSEGLSRLVISYGSATVSSGTKINLLRNGASYTVSTASPATLSVNLNSSSKIEIGFYNTSTGTSTVLFSGTASAKSVSYKPSGYPVGHFYLINKSSGTITMTSGSLTM